ncbi:MAG: 16S rRNA (cytidine(1402)-2'-O)-methyltransferase [Rhodobiaceae bacterium]|nr:16S rRNA (cytidine(1402)-2'-O)-methyltransferase [Rhodobiaceae bacterium]
MTKTRQDKGEKGAEAPPGTSSPRRFFIAGTALDAPSLPPGLHVVATPIGNLGDVTLRALQVLAAADRIACEDTRRSAILLRHYGIEARLVPYHEHNAARQRPRILSMIGDGESVALISDAGTPLVSDPGYRIVTDCIEAGFAVVPVPGASALLSGLVGAGLPSDRFWFEGFLPPKEKARRDRLAAIANIPGTLIFYESPARLAAALSDMALVFGPRRAVVARELTKLHETFERGGLPELAAIFSGAAVKGEIVILVGPPEREAPVEPADLDERLASLTDEKGARTASEILADETGLDRKMLYRRAIALGRGGKSGKNR